MSLMSQRKDQARQQSKTIVKTARHRNSLSVLQALKWIPIKFGILLKVYFTIYKVWHFTWPTCLLLLHHTLTKTVLYSSNSTNSAGSKQSKPCLDFVATMLSEQKRKMGPRTRFWNMSQVTVGKKPAWWTLCCGNCKSACICAVHILCDGVDASQAYSVRQKICCTILYWSLVHSMRGRP